MRTIAFEGSGLLVERPSGVATYGQTLVHALAERGAARYLILYPWGRHFRRHHVRHLGLPLRGYGLGRLGSRRVALLHALDTRLPRRSAVPLVATLFDILSALPMTAEKGFSSPRFREKKCAAYREVAARADCIVTLSNAVATEIRERLVPRGRVVVIPPGIRGPIWSKPPPGGRERLAVKGIRSPYFLVVGALCPRKNIGAALRAFELGRQLEPRLQLVLVGEIDFGWNQSPPARALERLRLEAPERVVQTGYLPRDLLWDAYAHARAVLFLSHYEGFGLPVVESQWVGTPVIASRRGGIPDASGGHAWLVDPESNEDLSAAVGAVLKGGDAVEARRVAARAHARSFSVERAAASVEALHNEVLGRR